MKSLRQLQESFQQAVLEQAPKAFIQDIKKDDTSFLKLNVYTEGYRLRLIEALAIDYPKVEVLLGDAFSQACHQYIDEYPSHHYSLRDFGKHFSYFLAQNKTYKRYPVLSEMADFEWALKESLDAPDALPFTVQELAQLPHDEWGPLKLGLHPSVHTRTYQWDTPQLWADIDQHTPPRQAVKLQDSQSWVFWRKDLNSRYESIHSTQELMLMGFKQKKTVADIALSLCDIVSQQEIPQVLVKNISYWIEQKCVTLAK